MPPWIGVLVGLGLASVTGNLEQVYLRYHSFQPGGRDPFLQPVGLTLKDGVTFGADFKLLPGVYWDNQVIGFTDATQYRTVAWDFSLYILPWKGLKIGIHHISRHSLDLQTPERFPVMDAVEITWTLFSATPARATVADYALP